MNCNIYGMNTSNCNLTSQYANDTFLVNGRHRISVRFEMRNSQLWVVHLSIADFPLRSPKCLLQFVDSSLLKYAFFTYTMYIIYTHTQGRPKVFLLCLIYCFSYSLFVYIFKGIENFIFFL